jgi:hypothetical protein
MIQAADPAQKLIEATAQFVDDPLGFTLFDYPWGEGQLAHHDGPDVWQAQALRQLGELTKTVGIEKAVQMAIGSGHGIGKSAWMNWVSNWAVKTRPNLNGVMTANTKEQLTGKTWRECGKWNSLSRTRDWMLYTATRFACVVSPKTWGVSAVPWSANNPEAFAGTHEEGPGGRVLMLFDESSNIEDIIWETADGAMTTIGAMWIACGNRTRNTGRFSQCFKRFRHRWYTMEIDSRTSRMANKKQLQEWVEDYGEDSDFVRVRIRGMEPRAGYMQFISEEMVERRMGKNISLSSYYQMPKIMGVDVARQGDDQSVITKRQGYACNEQIKLRIPDNMVVAGRVNEEIIDWAPDVVFVDQGAGVGVIDRLRQLGHGDLVVEVPFGSAADDPTHWFNKRTEMWGRMRQWIKEGGCLPSDPELRDDLVAPEYGFAGGGEASAVQLEKKQDTKKRLHASPDCADSLALTFAFPVISRSEAAMAGLAPRGHVAGSPQWGRLPNQYGRGYDSGVEHPQADPLAQSSWDPLRNRRTG